MTDTTTTQQTEFVLRRLSENLYWGNQEVNPLLWLVVLIPVLVAGLGYVAWMYVRDGRTVGPLWATFLAALRASVFLLLGGVFLLPALQSWERTEFRSKLLLLPDVSQSMRTSDEQASEGAEGRLPTRMDKVVQFLTDPKVNFLARLQQKNPVTVYRIGGRLDEDFQTFQGGRQWTAAESAAWLRMDLRQWLVEELSDEGKQLVRDSPGFQSDKELTPAEWVTDWLRLDEEQALPAGLSPEDRNKLLERRARLARKLDLRQQMLTSTNLGDSILAAFNRESNNMLQGIIVISDGRSNQGSAQAYKELLTRAGKAKVPIFSIVVGEDRPVINIRLTDLQAPEQAPPDDKFPVRVEIDGEGLAGREVDVFLDVYRPKTDKPALELKATAPFTPGEPPHAQVDFQIDPAQFAVAAAEGKKPETPAKSEFEEGEWKVVARVPKAKGEAYRGKEHVSDPAVVTIVKKPLRVLLMAGGPNKDYQFARTLLVREMDRKRAEVSIYLQTSGARERRSVQDVPPERLLTQFPTSMRDEDPKEKVEDRYYNLAQYDLIISFDLDWTQLQPDQFVLLQRWVEQHAGGLILVGGPINMLQLARGVNYEKLEPVLNLYPIVPEDSRLQGLGLDRPTTEPWRLNFPGATSEMEFLKLDDESKEPLAGWEEFFTGQATGAGAKQAPVRRGFFSYYPVKSVKPGATVIATFSDPRARLADGKEQPYLVTMPYGKGKVVYVSSAEIYRLRAFREVFFERFLTKLGRYASSGTQTRQSRRGTLVMGRQFTAGNYVRLQAQLFGPTLEPLPRSAKPKIQVSPPAGVTMTTGYEMQPRAGAGDFTGWFEGRFLVTAPGEYRVDLQVPGTGDVLRGKFSVKESNPELDNVRPDFGQMYQLASSAEDVYPRMDDAGRLELRSRLLRPRLDQADAKEAAVSDEDRYRLYFDLRTADIIPACMTADFKVQRSRGPVDDIWDDGPTLRQSSDGGPIKVATVLLVAVGLLSAEWLTRKLLKLA